MINYCSKEYVKVNVLQNNEEGRKSSNDRKNFVPDVFSSQKDKGENLTYNVGIEY